MWESLVLHSLLGTQDSFWFFVLTQSILNSGSPTVHSRSYHNTKAIMVSITSNISSSSNGFALNTRPWLKPVDLEAVILLFTRWMFLPQQEWKPHFTLPRGNITITFNEDRWQPSYFFNTSQKEASMKYTWVGVGRQTKRVKQISSQVSCFALLSSFSHDYNYLQV